MGDHADDALSNILDDDEVFTRCLGVDFHDLSDAERELMYDYDGTERPPPFSFHRHSQPNMNAPGPRMTFGKFEGWPAGEVNTGYLRYAVEHFDKMRQDMRQAIDAELSRRAKLTDLVP